MDHAMTGPCRLLVLAGAIIIAIGLVSPARAASADAVASQRTAYAGHWYEATIAVGGLIRVLPADDDTLGPEALAKLSAAQDRLEGVLQSLVAQIPPEQDARFHVIVLPALLRFAVSSGRAIDAAQHKDMILARALFRIMDLDLLQLQLALKQVQSTP
jgi:hypothetical protein